MNLSEILSDGFKYPTKDYLKLIIVGIFSFIPMIPLIGTKLLHGSALNNPDVFNLPGLLLGLLAFVLFVVCYFFIFGYLFSITRNTVQNNEDFPNFKFLDNFVDGIKVAVVHFVYLIIPSIISFIIGIAIIGLNMNAISALRDATDKLGYLSNNMGLVSQILIFALISVILYAIFSLLSAMAIGRFAKTENWGAAFRFKEVYNKIASIGIIRYIVLIVVMYIIIGIMACISGIIDLIPYYIGVLISSIILNSYMQIFSSRVIGLIYNEGDSDSETMPESM